MLLHGLEFVIGCDTISGLRISNIIRLVIEIFKKNEKFHASLISKCYKNLESVKKMDEERKQGNFYYSYGNNLRNIFLLNVPYTINNSMDSKTQ